MDILVINLPYNGQKFSRSSRWPEVTKSGTLYYPIWLSYATAMLMKEKLDVVLVDAIAKKWTDLQLLEFIKESKPKIIITETTTPTFQYDMRLAKKIKGIHDCILLLAGSHATACDTEIISNHPYIDAILRNEFELIAKELCLKILNSEIWQNTMGITYKKDDKIIVNPDMPLIQSLDEILFVSEVYKKFLDVKDYGYSLAKHPMIQVMSSRGCPNACIFCQWPQTLTGRKYRSRSVNNFVDELEFIGYNLPQVKEIFIEDDTFTVDKKRVLKICDEIIKRNLKIEWSTNCRADVPFDVLKKMKEAGCRLIVVGYESGNQQMLKNMKKGINIENYRQFTKNAKKLRFKIFGCFMIGLPGESLDTINDTFNFAKELSLDMVFFQQAVPFPGTKFYEYCKENGYLKTENYDMWLDELGRLSFIVSYPQLSNEEIKKCVSKMMQRYYTSPSQAIKTIFNINNTDEAKRVIRAAFKYFEYFFWRRT